MGGTLRHNVRPPSGGARCWAWCCRCPHPVRCRSSVEDEETVSGFGSPRLRRSSWCIEPPHGTAWRRLAHGALRCRGGKSSGGRFWHLVSHANSRSTAGASHQEQPIDYIGGLQDAPPRSPAPAWLAATGQRPTGPGGDDGTFTSQQLHSTAASCAAAAAVTTGHRRLLPAGLRVVEGAARSHPVGGRGLRRRWRRWRV